MLAVGARLAGQIRLRAYGRGIRFDRVRAWIVGGILARRGSAVRHDRVSGGILAGRPRVMVLEALLIGIGWGGPGRVANRQIRARGRVVVDGRGLGAGWPLASHGGGNRRGQRVARLSAVGQQITLGPNSKPVVAVALVLGRSNSRRASEGGEARDVLVMRVPRERLRVLVGGWCCVAHPHRGQTARRSHLVPVPRFEILETRGVSNSPPVQSSRRLVTDHRRLPRWLLHSPHHSLVEPVDVAVTRRNFRVEQVDVERVPGLQLVQIPIQVDARAVEPASKRLQLVQAVQDLAHLAHRPRFQLPVPGLLLGRPRRSQVRHHDRVAARSALQRDSTVPERRADRRVREPRGWSVMVTPLDMLPPLLLLAVVVVVVAALRRPRDGNLGRDFLHLEGGGLLRVLLRVQLVQGRGGGRDRWRGDQLAVRGIVQLGYHCPARAQIIRGGPERVGQAEPRVAGRVDRVEILGRLVVRVRAVRLQRGQDIR